MRSKSQEKIRTLQIFPHKTWLFTNLWIQRNQFLINLIIIFFRSCAYLAQWVESFSERERKKNENREPRKDRKPLNFPLKHTYKYIIYNSMHQYLIIFEKAIILFKFIAVLYLGEPQRLNFFWRSIFVFVHL